jgi:hypothetical protein
MEFRQYIAEGREGENDVRKTIRKIPKSHARLVKGYKFKFQPSNTLKGDDGHIGFIDEEEKTITIASPWNYGREYTLLHEIGHAVWKYAMDDAKKSEWKKILGPVRKGHKKELDQNDEEIFCMTYAQAYANNKMTKYDHDELVSFVRKIK